MRLLIQNGTILTAEREFRGDILIQDEKIVAVGEHLAGKAEGEIDIVIDAEGKYVMPGGVDQHTHFSTPSDVIDKEMAPYETTRSAIVGGTTTIVDYAQQEEGMSLAESVHYRDQVRARGKACVDYSLHALVYTRDKEAVIEEIKDLPQHGISNVKIFMAYTDAPHFVEDGAFFRILQECKKVGLTVFVHAENGYIIDQLRADFGRQGKTAPIYHAESRPPYTEGEGVHRAAYLAAVTGTPIFIAHVSCREALAEIQAAKGRGQRIYGETCTHYLMATKENLNHPDFDVAAKYICSPPLREPEDQEALWKALNGGLLSAIASDHCGVDMKELKELGREDFRRIPNGAPGAGDRLHMIWTNGVEQGKLTRQRFVDIFATTPAKMNGIYPQKGALEAGSDADIVIFDPAYRGKVHLADNPNGVDYNLYEGQDMAGRVDTVLLRGQVAVEGGKFVGQEGMGRFVSAKPYAAAYDNEK